MLNAENLLFRMENGEAAAAKELFPLVYKELRSMAARKLQSEGSDHSLSPTALVHEVYLKLAGTRDRKFDSKSHFITIACKAMRQVLIDAARKKNAIKRGQRPIRVALDENLTSGKTPVIELTRLNDALEALEEEYPDLGELVTLRYFGSMSMTEAAEIQGISLRTAERHWQFAKAWLQTELSDAL